MTEKNCWNVLQTFQQTVPTGKRILMLLIARQFLVNFKKSNWCGIASSLTVGHRQWNIWAKWSCGLTNIFTFMLNFQVCVCDLFTSKYLRMGVLAYFTLFCCCCCNKCNNVKFTRPKKFKISKKFQKFKNSKNSTKKVKFTAFPIMKTKLLMKMLLSSSSHFPKNRFYQINFQRNAALSREVLTNTNLVEL